MNIKGEISAGEFRADYMEGRLTYLTTLSKNETEKAFRTMIVAREAFISVKP